MGLNLLDVELRPELPLYFAGETIAGVVKTHCDAATPCKGKDASHN